MSAALIRKPCWSRCVATQPLARPVSSQPKLSVPLRTALMRPVALKAWPTSTSMPPSVVCTIISAKFTASTSQSIAA